MNKNIVFALQILGFSILISATIWSCKGKNDKVPGEDVIAVVDGAKLYKQDLIKIIPDFNNPEDSAAFVDEYVQNWIADQLLFIEAKKNLTDTMMIVKKLNDFRQQLYIHYYKESILFADIKTEVTQTEIDDYYNKHLQDYVLATSYVKAHYLTMDAKVTAYSDEWEKVSNSGPEDKKMLKDYCIGTGRKIYFIEEWTEIRNFLDIVNYSGEFSEAELGSRNVLDYINGSLRYLVKIDEFRSKGDFLPVELAVPEITQIIINNRKEDKLLQVKKDLKESATSAGTVIINK